MILSQNYVDIRLFILVFKGISDKQTMAVGISVGGHDNSATSELILTAIGLP
jgi:hypothetical protein